MGMDLIPRNDAENYHVNWTGWRFLWQLLDDLGLDTFELSGSNDGDVVGAETADFFGCAIEEALAAGRIRLRRTPDKSYSEGFFEAPVVLDEDAGEPETLLQVIAGEIVPLDQETREWLAGFASFCKQSGGFEQW